MDEKSGLQRLLSRWGMVFVALLFLVGGIWMLLPHRLERSVRVRISAGSDVGIRHAIAEKLASFAADANIQMVLTPTAGSDEALQKLIDGELDLALVQGGLQQKESHRLRQIAVLNVEALHLLVKPTDGLPIEGPFPGLAGKRVNVGQPGSGTNLLALELLQFARLEPGKDFEASHLSYSELMADGRKTEDLPDAVFTVSALPSPVANHLIHEHGFALAPLPLASAFRLNLGAEEQATVSRVARRRIADTTIPAFTYRVDPPVPSKDLQTLGCRLQLVASADLPEDDAERICELIYGSAVANFPDPPLSLEELRSDREYELHPGTSRYLMRKAPVVSEQLVEVTEQLVAIVATALGGLLFLWQWVRSSRQRARSREFVEQIKRVIEIENRTLNFENDDTMTVADLVTLQNELMGMKSGMIEDFQAGRIESTELLSTFLKHVNDAAELLARLILHERAPRVSS